jgi:hypothetical protein
MVVDSNYLQSQALRDYLSASTDNYAVLTDYAAMEAFKGDPQVIYRSMEILAERPRYGDRFLQMQLAESGRVAMGHMDRIPTCHS